jgi:asparagine synthase (glutamine-hydrolysing)
MAAALAHRGPDDEGSWESAGGTVSFAHRRLSVIDLSAGGRNPMSWDAGRLWITFNGEIYNFRELRRELESAGHTFRTQTDTEVVLAAYDEWGMAAVERLVGMFAFALWDAKRRRLWLVRDRLGKKPLYYGEVNGELVFASELKAVATVPGFSRDIDEQALRLYLAFGYIPSPWTIYNHVSKLPPAHYLTCENGRVTTTRYWDPVQFASSPVSLSDADAEAELESHLDVAVRQRMIADVPLGAFLSGGIDSSLVVALMQERSAHRVQTFTIRFDNPEYNESGFAAAVAQHLGTQHYEERCGDREMLEVVERLPAMFDEPFADSSAVPTYLVSRIAREAVTVALSGDGGDELFLGYPRYRQSGVVRLGLSLPRPVRRGAASAAAKLPTRRLRRIADVLQQDDPDHYARFITWWGPADLARMTGGRAPVLDIYADASARLRSTSAPQRAGVLDLVSYLPEDILTKVDRASMSVSLEVRAPLLDHRVVEFALGLPLRLKIRHRKSKWLLRKLLSKRVPGSLFERRKMGFAVPLDDWFRGPLRDRMNSHCNTTKLESLGIDPVPLHNIWAQFQAGQSHRTDLLWQMFTLLEWTDYALRPHRRAASAAS